MRGTSNKTKKREGRGTGTGADYKPWIRAREFPRDTGIRSMPVDWKHGRQMQLLSLNELWWYYILRWDDSVLDIREQYPLDKDVTDKIADMIHVKRPADIMTTDMLVTYQMDGREVYRAFSVKNKYDDIFGDLSDPQVARRVELQRIEMAYWNLKNIRYQIVFGDRDINVTYARNIAAVVDMYDSKNVHTRQDFLCYLIAHKYLAIETMSTEPLDFSTLTEKYLGDPESRKKWIRMIADKNMIVLQ